MRDGAILSSILHAVAIGVLVFGLPSFVTPLPDAIVPVELVVLEEEDIEKPLPEPEPTPMAEEPAPEPEPPKQVAKAEPPPPPAPAPEPPPKPPPPAEAKPEPLPAPEPPPPPEVKPDPKPKPVVKTPPRPRRRPEVKTARPKPPPEPTPPKPDQLASILRNVEKLRAKPKPQQREQTAKAETRGPVNRPVSVFEQNEMIRAIQQQLRDCWRLDPGAPQAEDMVVEIHVVLNPDGSVRETDIVDVVRMVQDGYFRSAAENAKRAIDICSPFRLPPKKYEVWRELTLRFNPREMFGT
ncbi:MAG: cell envelope integrity protein TolA [Kiloniellaceae bacterium]